MIFVDTNVFMFAVGREHPLREPAQEFFLQRKSGDDPLVTSAEVLQELLHAYLPVERLETLDSALLLARSVVTRVFPLEEEDVQLARLLAASYRALDSRDLVHLACCKRRGIKQVKTFDRSLGAAFRKG